MRVRAPFPAQLLKMRSRRISCESTICAYSDRGRRVRISNLDELREPNALRGCAWERRENLRQDGQA